MAFASIPDIYEIFNNSSGVCTDTRAVLDGNVFFALKGPNFDANQFASEALGQGAVAAVVDDKEVATNNDYLLVPDVLEALQNLATHHRRQFNIPFLGITGSNGKTTTKELIHVAISQKYNTLATRGNLNNHIGVPLTLLEVTDQTEFAIIEMGANHVGEIAKLCEIAEPSHGMITNIGKAHIEGFGGFEGVIRGKSELYHFLIQNQGKVFINSQNEILSNMGKRFESPFYYPAPGDNYECTLVEANPFVTVEAGGQTIYTKLVGKYNFENVAAALAIASYFEVPAPAALKAVAEYEPQNNRSQIVRKGSNTIILDAYNANPSSMESALENLHKMEATKKVAILGDMNELGETSRSEHETIVAKAQGYGLDQLILCGEKMQAAAPNHELCFANNGELLEYLRKQPLKDSLILVKASRSLALEKVLDAFE